MSIRTRSALLAALMVVGVSANAPTSHAAMPRIDSVRCVSECTGGLTRGHSLLQVSGSGLAGVRGAAFPGGRSARRTLAGRVGQVTAASVRVRVPFGVVSGAFTLRDAGGAVSVPRRLTIAAVPDLTSWQCVSACGPGKAIAVGSLLSVRGVRLGGVRDALVFNGRGSADDRRARVSNQRFDSLRLRVPAGAVSGAFAVRERRRRSPARRIAIAGSVAPAPAAPTTVPPGGIFPVRGEHTFGGAGARFGAPRPGHVHQGQDVPAACGTPLVSARAGFVRYAGYQSAAGNYLVVSSPEADAVYMHMSAPALTPTGAAVAAGQPIGFVGETGDADGCHLHLELWSPPGWYVGGQAFDPLPQLRAWDAVS